MPINKETIISVFEDKLTLMQWLKTINKALEDAVLTGVEITKKGNATLSFKFTFEDGTFLETNDLVLQQGESVVNAFIQNGHLYLTLSNGTNLDAGNVKPVSNFSINASQHLIVNYGDGTSQDLGAIFSGNINVSGNLTASGNVTASGTIDGNKVTGNEIVETMTGFSFQKENLGDTAIYVGCVKNGNKVTFVYFGTLTYASGNAGVFGYFVVPQNVFDKLYPYTIGTSDNVLSQGKLLMYDNESIYNDPVEIEYDFGKTPSRVSLNVRLMQRLTAGKTYLFRIEQTFLLSDNLIS